MCTKSQLDEVEDADVDQFPSHYWLFVQFHRQAVAFYKKEVSNESFPTNGSLVEYLLNTTYRNQFLSNFQAYIDYFTPRLNSEEYRNLLLKETAIVLAYLLIIFVSLFGNTLVLFIILPQQKLRSQTTNKLIANLTISDLMMTTMNIPLTIGMRIWF